MINWIKGLFGPRWPVLQTVVVNTRTGKAFRGVLWQRRGEYLVLRNAEMLKNASEAVQIAGELVIEAGNVDFMVVT